MPVCHINFGAINRRLCCVPDAAGALTCHRNLVSNLWRRFPQPVSGSSVTHLMLY